jgi:hypothetical protein
MYYIVKDREKDIIKNIIKDREKYNKNRKGNVKNKNT